jgi:arsenite methyltransferase
MMHPSHPRADYGFDAPGVMITLLSGGIAALALGLVIAAHADGWWRWPAMVLAGAGIVPLTLGLLMILYWLAGKARTRDHILDLAELRGDETVLDVGTGAGLLLVGAAKRVPRGRVIGIDALDIANTSVDRVLSLLCLHNITSDADQARACREIARVLKPGGRLVVGDYVPTHRYAAAFADAGLRVVRSRASTGVALSLMWIVVAEKPCDAG